MYVLILLTIAFLVVMTMSNDNHFKARWQNYTISDKDAETLQPKLEEK